MQYQDEVLCSRSGDDRALDGPLSMSRRCVTANVTMDTKIIAFLPSTSFTCCSDCSAVGAVEWFQKKSPVSRCAALLRILGAATMAMVVGCSGEDAPVVPAVEEGAAARLGEQLFSEVNLSFNRTQSCATCHDPEAAFVDARREEGLLLPASLGDDGESLGGRNAPTAAYAFLSPAFTRGTRMRHNTDGDISSYEGYLGGLFYDGRAADLEEQASGPPLNPIEMGLPDAEAVVERVRENRDYESQLTALFGADIWQDPDRAFAAVAQSIAAFERSETFAPFDSRYDRSLLRPSDDARYVFHPASAAAQGRALFFSKEFTNCAACHQLNAQGSQGAREEPFTGFEYHNLGVPENRPLIERSGSEMDLGLGGSLEQSQEDGKFKTPTLRNVALTGPYMHNGVFGELSTVIRFYEHAKQRERGQEDDSTNPETGEPWAPAEVPRNISTEELANGNQDLADDDLVFAMECFLISLTDARYEPLLDADRVQRCGL